METFEGKDRVLTPSEIMVAGLPMTLDTSHIVNDDRILGIVRDYCRNIPVVHLSARGLSEHHLPIDAFCLKVVGTLVSLGWSGNVVLEYLPWHLYRVRADTQLVRRASRERVQSSEIRPVSDAYRNRPEMWRHDALWP